MQRYTPEIASSDGYYDPKAESSLKPKKIFMDSDLPSAQAGLRWESGMPYKDEDMIPLDPKEWVKGAGRFLKGLATLNLLKKTGKKN